VKAIQRPFGDHDGQASSRLFLVSRRTPVPSGRIVQMSEWLTKTIRPPAASGEGRAAETTVAKSPAKARSAAYASPLAIPERESFDS
jgi:hypothetical protein